MAAMWEWYVSLGLPYNTLLGSKAHYLHQPIAQDH